MKSLVFPRIFLHCVALGFIVSGLLLRIKCRFDSCRERFQNEDSSFLYSATVLVLFFYFSFLLTKTTTPITAIQATQKITYDFEYLKIHISLQPDLTFKSSSNLWLSQNLFLRNTNIELQFIDIQFHLIKPFSGQCILPLSDRQNLSHN